MLCCCWSRVEGRGSRVEDSRVEDSRVELEKPTRPPRSSVPYYNVKSSGVKMEYAAHRMKSMTGCL